MYRGRAAERALEIVYSELYVFSPIIPDVLHACLSGNSSSMPIQANIRPRSCRPLLTIVICPVIIALTQLWKQAQLAASQGAIAMHHVGPVRAGYLVIRAPGMPC